MPDSLFKRQQEKVNTDTCQYLGAHLPEGLADRVALWAVHYQVPKAALFRRALEEMLPADKTIDTMLDMLADKIFKHWESRKFALSQKDKKKSANQHFDEYVDGLRDVLGKRGVRDELINSIIQKLVTKTGLKREKTTKSK